MENDFNDIKVLTVLGLVGSTKKKCVIENGKVIETFVPKSDDDKALYHFGPRLKHFYALPDGKRYINTLPLLCNIFSPERIVPVYTDKSKRIQEEVLKVEEIEDLHFSKEGVIEDERDFTTLFATLNRLLAEYNRVIVDITHGFRHLPVLMTIAMIMENIQNINKIEHIFFAKEIVPGQEYEIIDLKEYLDIANVSIVLSGFNRNYTLAHHIRCLDSDYQRLIDLLSEFSEHILANSIVTLIDSDNALVDRILQTIETIEERGDIGVG